MGGPPYAFGMITLSDEHVVFEFFGGRQVIMLGVAVRKARRGQGENAERARHVHDAIKHAVLVLCLCLARVPFCSSQQRKRFWAPTVRTCSFHVNTTLGQGLMEWSQDATICIAASSISLAGYVGSTSSVVSWYRYRYMPLTSTRSTALEHALSCSVSASVCEICHLSLVTERGKHTQNTHATRTGGGK